MAWLGHLPIFGAICRAGRPLTSDKPGFFSPGQLQQTMPWVRRNQWGMKRTFFQKKMGSMIVAFTMEYPQKFIRANHHQPSLTYSMAPESLCLTCSSTFHPFRWRIGYLMCTLAGSNQLHCKYQARAGSPILPLTLAPMFFVLGSQSRIIPSCSGERKRTFEHTLT